MKIIMMSRYDNLETDLDYFNKYRNILGMEGDYYK